MTLPEGVSPSGPTPVPEPALETTVTEAPVVTEPVTSDASVTVEEETPEEIASDAALRAWAKDNGIEDVPTSGRLSAAWREQITIAMAAALAPKEEASAEDTSSEPSTSSETMTEEELSGIPWIPDSTELKDLRNDLNFALEKDLENLKKEWKEEQVVEYRSVFEPPNTWVTSQHYTA